METWNWEVDDRLILTKSFKYPVIGLCFLGSFVCCQEYSINVETLKSWDKGADMQRFIKIAVRIKVFMQKGYKGSLL